MRGDEAGDVDTDCGEFGFGTVLGAVRFALPDSRGGCLHMGILAFRICPDACQAGHSLGGDGEVGAGADQDFLEAADEFDYA